MRYLRRYNESNRLDSFIDDLTKELENIDFDLNYSYESDFLQIDKQGVGTFIYFDISDFSIESLKKECNDKLNDDKFTKLLMPSPILSLAEAKGEERLP